MLIVLGVVVLAAGIYWGVQFANRPKLEVNRSGPEQEYVLACRTENCGWSKTVTLTELKALKYESGKYFCEKCKAYTCIKNRKRGGSIANP